MAKLKLKVPAKLAAGTTVRAQILDPEGKPVPNVDVLWSLSGSAWIDGGGTIHALTAGPATLQAYSRGQILSAKIDVTAKKRA